MVKLSIQFHPVTIDQYIPATVTMRHRPNSGGCSVVCRVHRVRRCDVQGPGGGAGARGRGVRRSGAAGWHPRHAGAAPPQPGPRHCGAGGRQATPGLVVFPQEML